MTTKTKKTNYRSLHELAATIHKVERSSAFGCGALLLEAKAGHPGEFLKWLEEEFEDEISEDTAERWMNVARLDQRIPQNLRNPLRNLKVRTTTYYALTDLKNDELPPVIERLAKESKRRWLKIAEAKRFIRIEQGRLKYGEHPDATLNAVMMDDFFSEDITETLLATNPETDEEVKKITEEVVQKARAQRLDDAEAKAEGPTDDAEADDAKADDGPTNDAEASAGERWEYADAEAAPAGDTFTRAATDAFTRAAAAADADDQDTAAADTDAEADADQDTTPKRPTIGNEGIKAAGKILKDLIDRFQTGEVAFILAIALTTFLGKVNNDDLTEQTIRMITIISRDTDATADESDITTPTKVERKVFSKALKKAGHELRKVKLS
jgi:hypothetical protein